MRQTKSLTQVQATSQESGSTHLYTLGTPDKCPQCHNYIQPGLVAKTYFGTANTEQSFLEIVFQCTNSDCHKCFIATYEYSFDTSRPDSHHFYTLKNVAPKTPNHEQFSDEIQEVSKDFVSIYNQAVAAEATGLDQISGIGLRKALEFLIKDFSINQHPTEIAKIKNTDLGKCITEYCDDARLKSAASRATWLGNDEAHYTRKWIDKDISDLKVLIKLSVNWIENVLLTQQYDKEMDPTKKKGAASAAS